MSDFSSHLDLAEGQDITFKVQSNNPLKANTEPPFIATYVFGYVAYFNRYGRDYSFAWDFPDSIIGLDVEDICLGANWEREVFFYEEQDGFTNFFPGLFLEYHVMDSPK